MTRGPVLSTVNTMADVWDAYRHELDGVEDRVNKNLDSSVALVNTVAAQILSGGGKRVRPLLLVLSARLCGYAAKEHQPTRQPGRIYPYRHSAIVHVQRADVDGKAHLWGIIGEQKEAAFAAKRVILTAEEIVDESLIRSAPNRTMIPGIVVSAVCHVPFACHPSYAQGYYERDNEFYLAWDKVSESVETAGQYLEEWVYGVKDRKEYWEKLGTETHRRLEVSQWMSQPINYGKY